MASKQEINDWQDNNIPDISTSIDEVNTILSLSYNEFNEMNYDVLFDYVWQLRKYALFLRCQQNKLRSRVNWIDNKILEVGKPLAMDGYSSYDKDERLFSAIRDNDFLRGLEEKKIDFKMKLDSIYDLDKGVNYLIVMLEKLLYFKINISSNKAKGNL